MTVLGILQVVAQGRVEYRELGHTVTQASTFLDGEEGELGGLGGADVVAVLVEGLDHVAEDVRALAVLLVACERIAIQTLYQQFIIIREDIFSSKELLLR